MRLAILADTHVGSIDHLPTPMLDALADVDLIVHAGDFTEIAVLEGLRSLGEVKAVCGNMDSIAIRMVLPPRELFVVAGKKIGLVHGTGPPLGLVGRVRSAFSDADIIIFGHSHLPCNRHVRGTLVFNPGRCRESFGLLTIDDEIRAEVVRI